MRKIGYHLMHAGFIRKYSYKLELYGNISLTLILYNMYLVLSHSSPIYKCIF